MARGNRKDAQRKKIDARKAEFRKSMGLNLATDMSHLNEEGFVTRLMNNENGRIQKAMQLGWEPVECSAGEMDNKWRPDADKSTSETTIKRIPVGSLRTEDAGEAILMKIDIESFQALREIEEERLSDMDRALKGGAAGAEGKDVQGVQTYAAETSSGGRGFDVQTEN